jgi:isopentenyl-diphosphate delta-isomerase
MTYRAELNKGMIEHEFLHVFVGSYDADPVPDPTEADSFRRMTLDELQTDIAKDPDSYTAWLKICLPRLVDYL